MAWAAYRLMAPCLGAIAPAARALSPAAERPLWGERMGHVRLEGGCDAWVHAASLGEATAVGPLARALLRHRPDARLHFTAATRTGRMRLGTLGPATLAPIDSPQAVRAFFDGVAPKRLLIVETELWPHWLLEAERRGVPVAIVSARLSAGSLGRYRALGGRFRRLVSGLAAVLCQSAADEARWRAIGADPSRVRVTGNLKDDALPAPCADRAAARAALGLDPGRPLLVLASVRPGEVRIVARAWRALPDTVREDWQVVAVPRHAHASAEMAEEARTSGLTLLKEGAPRDAAWRWDARPGVLLGYDAAAEVAIVGGTLRPYGGHNPLEPAACGAAVIVGPYHGSQLDAVRALREGGGVTVVSGGAELATTLHALLGDPAARAALAAAALNVIAARRGSAERTVRALESLGVWSAAAAPALASR
jgi:3-deoxy-D-manno-octulosonic-acid transferase